MSLPNKPTAKVSEVSSDPLVGQTLGGKYAIVRMIGRGGVGLVYHARQTNPGRDVVVKVLAPHWASDAEAMARFDREARRLSSLQHPNIVEMFDFGHEDDRAYLVMEYLAGELLSEHVARKKRLSLEEFVPIAAQILKGIGHAHSRELMVRDVKPANVMLCERKGRANFVKILDFGLAKLLRGEQAITEEHVMGTVGYLAPEAIRGEPIDLRVDVYAIGVLFYYMLAGRLPFEGETNAAVFYKTIHEAPRDLRDLLGQSHGLPDGLVDLVHQCLAKDPDARPADADRIVERLIDVVPAALFRLPRSTTERHGIPLSVAPGIGNTGLIELVGDGQGEAPLDSATPTPIPGTLRPVASPPPNAGQETGRASVITEQVIVAPPRTVGLVAMSVVAGALLAVVIVGALLWMMRDDARAAPDPAIAGKTSEAGLVAPPASLDAALDRIDAQIGRGEFDLAAMELDRIRSTASADAGMRARVSAADERVVVARLLASAARFEAEGDIEAAKVAYGDVLGHDANHALAKSALARLSTAAPIDPGPPSSGDAILGAVQINARPNANVAIDGTEAGTTPYRGKLPVGRHTVRITARGYAPWEGTIEVAATGNVPVSVQLRGKGPGHRDAEPATGPATTPTTPATPPTAPVEPKPATIDPVPTTKPKKDPFLPTKPPSGDGDVFLPVNKGA
jgi:eukaryotic-like serine/threonine-protein kinase